MPAFRKPHPGFLRARSGATAVEFALIAPVLVVVLMGIVEIPRAYATSQALARSARTLADLISRGSVNDLGDVYAAGKAVAYPRDLSGAAMTLTAVGVYAQGGSFVAKACSSAAVNASPRPAGSVIGPPVEAEARAGARYVMAEVSLAYRPVLNFFPALTGLTLSKTVAWPVRTTGASTAVEAVLPGGKPCPAT